MNIRFWLVLWGVLVCLALIGISLQRPAKIVHESHKFKINVVETPKTQVAVSSETTAQGGTYSSHGAYIDIKTSKGEVLRCIVNPSTFIVIQDQINNKRTEVNMSQMLTWLDVNKSETLAIMVGISEGKVSDIIVLVPSEKSLP